MLLPFVSVIEYENHDDCGEALAILVLTNCVTHVPLGMNCIASPAEIAYTIVISECENQYKF